MAYSKNMEKEYAEKRKLFVEGKISEKEWSEFCKQILFDKIEENKDIFCRMKFR